MLRHNSVMAMKPYLVMQVQKVLKNLVLEGCLEQEHIALLWDLTEKVSCVGSRVCLLSLDCTTYMHDVNITSTHVLPIGPQAYCSSFCCISINLMGLYAGGHLIITPARSVPHSPILVMDLIKLMHCSHCFRLQ